MMMSMSRNLVLKRLTGNWGLVSADPMQYFEKPWGWMRNWHSISSTGEKT